MARMPRAPLQEPMLRAICEIGVERLRSLADVLSADQGTINQAKIRAIIIEHTDDANGSELFQFLFNTLVGAREDALAPDKNFARVSEWAVRHEDAVERFPQWAECANEVRRLLQAPSLRLSAKAMEVSYDFERVYHAGRFLTTVRPVFDEPRNEILAATVVQTLRLEFFSSSSGELSNLSIALDRSDIVQLRDACEAALRKAAAAYQKASDSWGLPTVMPGEDAVMPGEDR